MLFNGLRLRRKSSCLASITNLREHICRCCYSCDLYRLDSAADCHCTNRKPSFVKNVSLSSLARLCYGTFWNLCEAQRMLRSHMNILLLLAHNSKCWLDVLRGEMVSCGHPFARLCPSASDVAYYSVSLWPSVCPTYSIFMYFKAVNYCRLLHTCRLWSVIYHIAVETQCLTKQIADNDGSPGLRIALLCVSCRRI